LREPEISRTLSYFKIEKSLILKTSTGRFMNLAVTTCSVPPAHGRTNKMPHQQQYCAAVTHCTFHVLTYRGMQFDGCIVKLHQTRHICSPTVEAGNNSELKLDISLLT